MKRRNWTPVAVKPCRACGRAILRGDLAREIVRADSMPLNIAAQKIVAGTGRELFEVRFGDRRLELFPYDESRINDSIPAIVVADHTGCVEWPAFAIDRAANDRLYDWHHPDPPPELFEPPF